MEVANVTPLCMSPMCARSVSRLLVGPVCGYFSTALDAESLPVAPSLLDEYCISQHTHLESPTQIARSSRDVSNLITFEDLIMPTRVYAAICMTGLHHNA